MARHNFDSVCNCALQQLGMSDEFKFEIERDTGTGSISIVVTQSAFRHKDVTFRYASSRSRRVYPSPRP